MYVNIIDIEQLYFLRVNVSFIKILDCSINFILITSILSKIYVYDFSLLY
jgi:hypothetical protein